jgi:tripeptide aminopeptidase
VSAVENRRIASLASDRSVHKAFSWLHLHEPQLRRWQLEFLAIPAPPFGEPDRAAWFIERFKEIGLEDPHLDAEGNAIGELRSAKYHASVPKVLLSAHLDTVFPPGTICKPYEEESAIFCPGACDNGAGLAGLLGIAAAMKHAEILPPCTILFAANVGEEGEGDLRGMRHIFSSASPYAGTIQSAIALEGSGNATVVDRALGSRRLRITVTGPGGHSWADAGRANPIVAMSAALVAIASLRLPSKPRTTLNCGVIHGGTSVNSIPESVTADVDLRSVSALELDRIELAVLNTLAICIETANERLAAPALHLHVRRIGDRAAGFVAPSSSLMTSLRAVDRHLNLATELRIGSTDANLPLSLGIPAIAIGAGGSGWGIHTLAEGYNPTGRDLALRRILLLLLDTCALAAANTSGQALPESAS